MPDITFYSWMIIANVYIAAGLTASESGKALRGIGIGVMWLLLATIGKLVG